MNRAINVTVGILMSCWVSVSFGQTINFSGQLDMIATDNGSATYSGVALGTPFNGALTYGTEAQSIPDITVPGDYDFVAPFGGFITDGVTPSSDNNGLQVSIRDNTTINQNEANILNTLFPGSSFAANDQVDSVDIDLGIPTAANGELVFGITYFTTDLATISGTDFSNLTPTLFDSGNLLFFIEETDSSDNDIYVGFGAVDSKTVIPMPSAGGFLGVGLACLSFCRRRKI